MKIFEPNLLDNLNCYGSCHIVDVCNVKLGLILFFLNQI
jgi:hypothetical protein